MPGFASEGLSLHSQQPKSCPSFKTHLFREAFPPLQMKFSPSLRTLSTLIYKPCHAPPCIAPPWLDLGPHSAEPSSHLKSSILPCWRAGVLEGGGAGGRGVLERRGSLRSRTGGGVLRSEGTGGIQETLAETRPRRAATYYLTARLHLRTKCNSPGSWATEKPNAALSQKGQALLLLLGRLGHVRLCATP